jgi:hypothetical protein
MSLMDVDNTDRALGEARRILTPGGFLQFSILHPCFSAIGSRKVFDDNGDLIDRSSGKYFTSREGEKQSWTFGAAPDHIKAQPPKFIVPRFHRPISSWANSVIAAGFQLEALQEPRPTAAKAKACSDVADCRIAPLFLHLRARKPI